MTDFRDRAAHLDARDPLASFRERFVQPEPGSVRSYLDGNSLGRPTQAVADQMPGFIARDWGSRLIRGWDESWLHWPEQTGDMIASACLGAAPGQTIVGDSTTVLLYKLARAGADAQKEQGRDEIVVDTDNFPTDRYVMEGIAAERGMTLRWIEADPESGVTADQVREVLGPRTALVVLSHVAYRSAYLADMATITRDVHDAGGLVLWDLCHSVGSVPVELDACGVDLAVGCTYKYLNGGPGAPAFAYVANRHHGALHNPIQGWMGRRDIFEMGPGYAPAEGIRSFVSGTPPVLAMLPVRAGIEMIGHVGIHAIRAKSLALTDFCLEVVDSWPADLGVSVATPREHERRGGHITIRHPRMREVYGGLWDAGVIPDFRAPDGLRLGLSPLTTSFSEVAEGLAVIREALEG